MYALDFLKNITKKSNIGVLIWMILNVALIALIGAAVAETIGIYEIWLGSLVGVGLYFLSVFITLSPVGEWILRCQQKCRRINDPELINRLEPLFNEVYMRAKEATPHLNDNIELFISKEKHANAFATGRSTVCITEGMLTLSDEEIMGALAHEFGHLAHKDTDALLMVAVGNMIVTAIYLIINFVVWIFSLIVAFIAGCFTKKGWGAVVAVFLKRIFIDSMLALGMWLWTKLGVLICNASSRGNEYLADEYAYNLGFGDELVAVLGKLGGKGTRGLWAALHSSHPKTEKRIERLRSYV